MNGFILCAGEQQRFGLHDTPKQLLDIGGVSILGKLLKQFESRGVRCTVVTHRPEVADAHDLVLNPLHHDTIIHTLASTAPLWNGRTAIILGDVIFGEEHVDLICKDTEPVQFWKTPSEIYALTFDEAGAREVRKAAKVCIDLKDTVRMHHLFHVMHGDGVFSTKVIDRSQINKHYIGPPTGDVDSWESYLQTRKELGLSNKGIQ